MINQIDSGVVVSYTNATGSDIAAGAVVVMGKMCGIAIVDIANGATGNVSIKGKYKLTKKTATDVIAQGTVLVYDAGVEAASAASTLDAVIVGHAGAASSSASTTVDAILGL